MGANGSHHAGAVCVDGRHVKYFFTGRLHLIVSTPVAADGVGLAAVGFTTLFFTTLLTTSTVDGRALLLPALDLDLDEQAWG